MAAKPNSVPPVFKNSHLINSGFGIEVLRFVQTNAVSAITKPSNSGDNVREAGLPSVSSTSTSQALKTSVQTEELRRFTWTSSGYVAAPRESSKCG